MFKLDSSTSSNFSHAVSSSEEQTSAFPYSSTDPSNGHNPFLNHVGSSHLVSHADRNNQESAFPCTCFASVPSAAEKFPSYSSQDQYASSKPNATVQKRSSVSSREQTTPQASKDIAPKPVHGELGDATTTTSHSGQLKTITGPNGSAKIAIAKAPYVRQSYPKKMCPHCTEHPDGFRGEHELRRHIDRAHAVLRKMWICVDPTPGKKFLASCKQCKAQKRYGAYYNAAAHLRRAHFNPKRHRGRGRGKVDEKRGGKGGGDFPPMEELKKYMREVDDLVIPTEAKSPVDDTPPAVAPVDAAATAFDASSQFPISPQSSTAATAIMVPEPTGSEHLSTSPQTNNDYPHTPNTWDGAQMSNFNDFLPFEDDGKSMVPPYDNDTTAFHYDYTTSAPQTDMQAFDGQELFFAQMPQ